MAFTFVLNWLKGVGKFFNKQAQSLEKAFKKAEPFATVALPYVARLSNGLTAFATTQKSETLNQVVRFLQTEVRPETDKLQAFIEANKDAPAPNIAHNAVVFALTHINNPAVKDKALATLTNLELGVKLALAAFQGDQSHGGTAKPDAVGA